MSNVSEQYERLLDLAHTPARERSDLNSPDLLGGAWLPGRASPVFFQS
jgi:hypothetical protein